MRVLHDALNESAVVRPCERFSFAQGQRPTAAEVGNASLVVVGRFLLDGRQDEVGNLMLFYASRGHSELAPARLDARLEKCPAHRKEHQLRIGPPKGRPRCAACRSCTPSSSDKDSSCSQMRPTRMSISSSRASL